MRQYYKKGKTVEKKKSKLGMVSVNLGLDKNKDVTQADIKGKYIVRKKAMGGGMMRKPFRKGGDTHVTKEGKTARKGLWYNIHQKRKRGEKMRAKGAKVAPTEKAIKKSQA